MAMTDHALDKHDRRAIVTISSLAGIALVATLFGLVSSVVMLSTSQSITIFGALAPSAELLPSLSGAGVSASSATIDLEVVNAPSSVRGPLVGATIAAALTPLSITIGIFLVGRQIARQRFRRALAFTAAALSAITLGSALFAPFLNAIAASEALRLGPLGDAAPFAFPLSAEVLAVPALLLIVGVLVAVSELLQKQTEGLV